MALLHYLLALLLWFTSSPTVVYASTSVDAVKARRLVNDLLPPLTSFTFTANSEQVIPGSDATECKHGHSNTADPENMPAAAVIGNLALLTMRESSTDWCFTDGRYNNRDYRVELGELEGSDGSKVTSYRVHPPTTLATEWSASHVKLHFRTLEEAGLLVYTFDGWDFTKQAQVITEPFIFYNTGIRVDSLSTAIIVVCDTVGVRMTPWPLLSPTVEGAWLSETSGFSVTARRFTGTGDPFAPETDWIDGPAAHSANYAIPKKFFPVDRSDGLEGVVWQDQSSHNVYMTWFSLDLLSSEKIEIYNGRDILMAAAADGVGQLVLIMVSEVRPAAGDQPTTATAIKVSSSSGQEIARRSLDTNKQFPGLDIHEFSTSGASIAWNTNTGMLGLVLARTMTQSSDGLNHQGAIAIVIEASSLSVVRNRGQTSGHSFANSLTLSKDGSFLGMDLGDNYPRGVNVWKFDAVGSWPNFIGMFNVYSFKTRHQTSSSNGRFPEYTEVSTAETKYYKWSNDNNVYTELGHSGLHEVDDGILIFFAGESPPLDNSEVGAVLNKPRNVGFVKVGQDLASKTVLSPGGSSTGGFYDYGGSWQTQTNTGINFLTGYNAAQGTVSRLKSARLGTGKVLLLWEVWSPASFVSTHAMTVNDDGVVVQEKEMLNYPMRLPIQDDLRVKDGRAVAYAGSKSGHIIRYEVCVGSSCPSSRGDGGTNVDGYTHMEGACVSGHNIVRYSGKTASECALLCDATPGSVAFEFGVQYGGSPFEPGDCVCQDSSDSSGCPGRQVNLDLYVKQVVISYTRHSMSCVSGHNIAKHADKSLEDCAAICDGIPNSVGFEYGVQYGGGPFQPRDCICQDSGDYSGCLGGSYNLDLYIKTPVAGYTRHGRTCVKANNIKKLTGKSPTECAAICAATPNSPAFEFGVPYGGSPYQLGDCICQSSSDSSGCDGPAYNLDLYVRDTTVSGYTRYAKACVKGHNIAVHSGKTLVECASICSGTVGSVAFEIGVEYGGDPYKPGDCLCQDSTTSSDAGICDGGAVNLDLYVSDLEVPGYTRLPKACVRGGNIAEYSGKTLIECASICSGTPGSVAFEIGVEYGGSPYKPGDCFCQDSTDSSGCDGGAVNFDLYVNDAALEVPGYARHAKACVRGHNIAKDTDKTLAECASICSATVGSVAFEFGVAYGGSPYNPGDCICQDSSDSSGCNGGDVNLDLYVKTRRLSEAFSSMPRAGVFLV